MDKKKNSVLIVDDEVQNIMVLSDILKADYTIYAVRKGAEVPGVVEKHRPDLILLDIIMPETDGFDVIAKLKSHVNTKSIPVIFISGLNDTLSEEKGLFLGAADYITKPFSPVIVRLRVQNQMQIINLRRELEAALKTLQTANISWEENT